MRRPTLPGPRQVARLLLPAFLASALVILVGVLLTIDHHRTVGVILVVVGVIGGFGLRAWLMLRDLERRRTAAQDPPEGPGSHR